MFKKLWEFTGILRKRASKPSYWIVVATRILVGVAIAVIARHI